MTVSGLGLFAVELGSDIITLFENLFIYLLFFKKVVRYHVGVLVGRESDKFGEEY